jgi:photosystem II stability/assembly factor-like uncharacterized protein
MKKIFLIIFMIAFSNLLSAQTLKILTSGTKTSLRGLSVVSDKTVWVSGSGGAVGITLDGGANWNWLNVKGFEKRDFRDIEAFNDSTAIIMAVDEPAYILKTSDAGKTWKTVYSNFDKGMFLDAMDFNGKNGIVIGDPINGKFFVTQTNDEGESWQNITFENRPVADSGEACFASSGTNVRMLKNKKSIFISGGAASHLYYDKMKRSLPILQGKTSAGANSIAFKNKKMFIVVGGDFNLKNDKEKNCCITFNGGITWFAPSSPPLGYRSCIEFIKQNTWITCGLNGIDISTNNGIAFKSISTESFNVCRKSPTNNVMYFAGSNGKIGSYEF